MRTTLAVFLSAFLTVIAIADDATPTPQWNPADDLTAMQGKWELGPNRTIFNVPLAMTSTVLSKAETQLARLRLEGNRLYLGDSKDSVALGNDLKLETVRAEAAGHHLFSVTFPDGRVFLGSYQVKEEELTIRFPETCTCNRTGMIAHYVRPKEAQPKD